MKAEDIKKYFEKRKEINSIGHAYLFFNVKYENIERLIEYILRSIIFENQLAINNNPDVYIVEPDKDIIKKEKILELEEKIFKTSQIGNNKVYIIKECEKLNASAANCLLKTLEEPSENIYSFLITSNIDFVIPTIKSRCQMIRCETINNDIIEKELVNNSISIINMLETYATKSIAYCSNELHKSFDKETLKKILKLMQLFYKDCLNKIYKIKIENFNDYDSLISEVIKNNDHKKILKKIKILNDNINLLKYNLNINLFVDKFIIEFGRL